MILFRFVSATFMARMVEIDAKLLPHNYLKSKSHC